MTEPERDARNAARLLELYTVMRARVAAIIHDLEQEGYRPRIQAAYRSPADQLAAYRSGHSKLRWGFHNATAADGTPEALAVDLLDDDRPLEPTRAYMLALARLAAVHRCQTGIAWGLPKSLRIGLQTAINTHDTSWSKYGWDSLHVQPSDITVAAALAGARPLAP